MDLPIRSYDHFSENCTEAQKTCYGIEDHLVNASPVDLPPSNVENSIHTYLGGLLLVYISPMCTQKRTFDHLINRYGIPANLLMRVLHLCSCEFFLDLWRRSLWDPLFRALRFPVWLRRFVWISPGLWFCDRSEIESKSSRFRCLSLPVAWSHQPW